MMDRKRYEEAEARLGEVTGMLKHGEIGPKERANLEKEGKKLARVVMSPLLPFRWDFRIAMTLITAVGLWGVSQGNYPLALIWLLLPIFSPRIIGKCILSLTGLKDL